MDSGRNSLFFYQPEESWDTFYDPFFNPSYKPNFTNLDLELQANEICGDDIFCLFDIATTGIKEVGIATHESSELIEEIYTYLIPGKYPLQNTADYDTIFLLREKEAGEMFTIIVLCLWPLIQVIFKLCPNTVHIRSL